MNKIMLNGSWDVVGMSPHGEEISLVGTVPGSALNDVLNAKIEDIDNVFWRDNAEAVQKYENYNWKYTKTFSSDEDMGKSKLVFEKLDTYCDIYLNGKHIGYCDNAFIRHSFVVDNIKKGENTLEIYFYSPITRVLGKKPREGAFTSVDRLYTRRVQCTYGWDWTMRFVSCGLSGDVYAEKIEGGIKIKNAYVYTENIDEYSAKIGVDTNVEDFEAGDTLYFEIIDNNGEVVRTFTKYCEEDFVRFEADIINPKLWYPLGYGEQNLYKLCISAQGKKLYETSFGIRTVKILEIPDAPGSENYKKCVELKKSDFSLHYDQNTEFSGFTPLVNGTKIMCKGTNWVPCEPFAKGSTDKKITETLEFAAKAGVNMIRIWGGGDFETEHFYDECSRLGIMVTQDFLMACGKYPDDEAWFLEHLQKESAYIVEKIRNKPCLMWWTGDNENAVEGSDIHKKFSGRNAAQKGIAPVLLKADPYRRFLPSSPYGGVKYASNTAGTTHNTQFLASFLRYVEESDCKDYKDYFKLYNARFIAEEPSLGATSEDSLKSIMTPDDIYGESMDMWRYHTKTNPALKHEVFDYMVMFAKKILGDFKNPEDRLFKFQYLQYEWIRVSLERVRREKWFCSGIIYWMLNDCWPAAAGWALIDYYGKPKSGYYSFKRGAKPVVLSLDLEGGKYQLHASNDGKEQNLKIKWYAINSNGEVVYESPESEAVIAENSARVVLETDECNVPEGCIAVAEAESDGVLLDRAFYKKGDLEINKFDGNIEITVEDDCVKVKSESYVHAVRLEGDALFEDNYFSLMPGKVKTVPCTKNGNCEITATGYTF